MLRAFSRPRPVACDDHSVGPCIRGETLRADSDIGVVRLGAPETRRPFPVADRQDRRAEARSGSSRARHPRAADLNTVCLYRYQPSGFDWATSTHSACTSAASRAGSIRSAAFGAPAAGSTTSNVLNVTSTNTDGPAQPEEADAAHGMAGPLEDVLRRQHHRLAAEPVLLLAVVDPCIAADTRRITSSFSLRDSVLAICVGCLPGRRCRCARRSPGFHDIWVPDHYMIGANGAVLDGWTTLCVLAGATRRVRLCLIQGSTLFATPPSSRRWWRRWTSSRRGA